MDFYILARLQEREHKVCTKHFFSVPSSVSSFYGASNHVML